VRESKERERDRETERERMRERERESLIPAYVDMLSCVYVYSDI